MIIPDKKFLPAIRELRRFYKTLNPNSWGKPAKCLNDKFVKCCPLCYAANNTRGTIVYCEVDGCPWPLIERQTCHEIYQKQRVKTRIKRLDRFEKIIIEEKMI